MEEHLAEEALVLTSINNLLSEAVRWTSKKRYSLFKIVVQEESDIAETKSLPDLIQELEAGRTRWQDGGDPGSTSAETGPENSGERERDKHLTTLKYISQLSDKLLKTCTKEDFTLNSDDFSDLEEKRGHLLPKRVKEEMAAAEDEPMLSRDLVQFLNELEENESDHEAAASISHITDINNPDIKMELVDTLKENATALTEVILPTGENKKLKKKLKSKSKLSYKKMEPKKENVFAKFKCFECEDNVDLGDKKSFKSHWETHHVTGGGTETGEPKIRCRFCQKEFVISNNALLLQQGDPMAGPPRQRLTWDVICAYLLHLVVNHAVEMPEWIRSYKCDATDCKFVTLDEFSLDCHYKVMKYDCAQCGMHFSKKQRRTSHVMSRHSDRAPEGRSKRLHYSQYKCLLCTQTKDNSDACEIFPDTDALTDHVKEVHTGQKEYKGEVRDFLQCTVCMKQIILEYKRSSNYMISRGLAALLHHMVSYHQTPIPSFIQPFKCPGCPTLFVHMEALLAHSRSHVDKITGVAKRSQCYKCGKFIKVSALNCHLRICQVPLEKRTNYPCPVCNEIFITRSGMTRHLKATHTGENNFLCHLCTNVYKSKYALQYHMHRAHQFRAPGAEVYYCQVQSCSYSSLLSSDVKKHEMRVHNIGEPPAECHICGKKVKKRYLKKHQSLHNKPMKQMPPSLPKPGPGMHHATLSDVIDMVPICGNDVPTSGEIEIESHQPHHQQHHHQHQSLQHMLHHQVAAPQQIQQQQTQQLPQQHNQVDHSGTLGRIGLQVVYNHYMS